MTLAAVLFFVGLGAGFFAINRLGREVRGGFTYAWQEDALSVKGPLLHLTIPYTAIEEGRLERSCPQGRTAQLVCPTTHRASLGPSVRLTLSARLGTSRVVYLTPAEPTAWLRQLEERRGLQTPYPEPMNIWGTGSFENEVGAAFAQEVVEDGTFALAEAFDVALDPDTEFLAAEEGHRTLAAAEILVAALTGDKSWIKDEPLRAWVAGANLTELEPLRDLARGAVARVLGHESELPDLWADSGDADEWRAEGERLRAALE